MKPKPDKKKRGKVIKGWTIYDVYPGTFNFTESRQRKRAWEKLAYEVRPAELIVHPRKAGRV